MLGAGLLSPVCYPQQGSLKHAGWRPELGRIGAAGVPSSELHTGISCIYQPRKPLADQTGTVGIETPTPHLALPLLRGRAGHTVKGLNSEPFTQEHQTVLSQPTGQTPPLSPLILGGDYPFLRPLALGMGTE